MPIRPIDPAKRGLRPVVRPTTMRASGVAKIQQKQLGQASSAPTPSEPTAPNDGIIVPKAAKRAHHKVDRTTDNWDENGDYKVGKRRPPKHTQWKPGQSGNPAGPKAKEVVDPMTRLDRHILADFTVRQNGEEVPISMGEFAINTLKANAAKGITKAQLSLLEIFLSALRRQAAAAGDTTEMRAWEQQVVDGLLDHLNLPSAPVVRAEREIPDENGDQ